MTCSPARAEGWERARAACWGCRCFGARATAAGASRGGARALPSAGRVPQQGWLVGALSWLCWQQQNGRTFPNRESVLLLEAPDHRGWKKERKQ